MFYYKGRLMRMTRDYTYILILNFIILFNLSPHLGIYAELPRIPCPSVIKTLSLNQTLRYLGAEMKEHAPRVFVLKFCSHPRLCYSFMRAQEHYEGPFYRNKIFTMSEYKKWYRKNVGRAGRFSYVGDWGGFNIPSEILKPFSEGRFNPLSRLEHLMVRIAQLLGENFYLVGIPSKSDGTLEHEIAHGLWSTNPTYRNRVKKIMQTQDLGDLREAIKSTGGYHEDVLEDETHAYLISGYEDLYKGEARQQAAKRYGDISDRLHDVLDEYLD